MKRVALVLFAALLGGCASLDGPGTERAGAAGALASTCASVSWPPSAAIAAPDGVAADSAAAGPASSQPDAAAVAALPYSPRSIRTAAAIGALPELVRLHALAGTGDDERAALRRLLVRQRVLERVSLASLEVSAVLAELDCEGERTDQLRDRLQRREDARLRRLTLGGIVVGAVTAISGGALSLASRGRASDLAQILGGSTETAIGLSTLADSVPARLAHPRNLIAAVWADDGAAGAFPPSVWNHLRQPAEGVPGEPTHRADLISQWRSPERLGEPGSSDEARRVALLTGQGGDYTLADLHVRDSMLDLLEARVALFHQALAALLREVLAQDADRP